MVINLNFFFLKIEHTVENTRIDLWNGICLVQRCLDEVITWRREE